MINICLYPHPSSLNHGCEAIAVCTNNILRKSISQCSITLGTKYEWSDKRSGTDLAKDLFDKSVLCTLPVLKRFSYDWFKYQIARKVGHKDISIDIIAKRFLNTHKNLINENELFLSIGGDNYCYGRPTGLYAIHKAICDSGKKSVLYGCSIEPSAIDQEMMSDLNKYNLIICRETITYDALVDKGLKNVVIYPDPAFTLEKSEFCKVKLPSNTVGINVSPMIFEYSTKSEKVFLAFVKLIKHFLEKTSYNVALIPHVTAETTDDRKSLKKLYEAFDQNERLILFDDMNCSDLKSIISQCRFFVGARTHATIAAYSSCVPTLVCGYSVKAKGIAKDLFGSYENYVVPVQSISDDRQLLDAFLWIEQNEAAIREKLETKMPMYIEKAYEVGKVIVNEF